MSNIKKRPCDWCAGDGWEIDQYQDDEGWLEEDEIVSGIVYPSHCEYCENTGMIDDVCYCAARCWSECACLYHWEED